MDENVMMVSQLYKYTENHWLYILMGGLYYVS